METSPIEQGPVIRRWDQRFYIPLIRLQCKDRDTRSIVVARVTSDGFDSQEETEEFAKHLARAWNIYVKEYYGAK